ncbi:hypothetical protein T11_11694 [Trichinella zimbabwensis]|uniref:Uncharacterized protein n=1 Tax=Trichinella zimbabwensis TaxID=268475 RepID=A0A0V1HCF3_9BILA|nr:hypothetical protein T11_11694 [Trichinella zimbabwensis]
MPNGGSTQTPPLGIKPGKHLHIPPKHIDPPTHSVNGLQNWPESISTNLHKSIWNANTIITRKTTWTRHSKIYPKIKMSQE